MLRLVALKPMSSRPGECLECDDLVCHVSTFLPAREHVVLGQLVCKRMRLGLGRGTRRFATGFCARRCFKTGSPARCLDDPGMRGLANGFPQLTRLNLSYCSGLTDRGVAQVVHLKRLTYLNVQHCNLLTDNCTESFRHLPDLTFLGLAACTGITDIGLRRLCGDGAPLALSLAARPGPLEVVDLSRLNRVTDAGLLRLVRAFHSSLRVVDVSKCGGVTDDGVAAITRASPGLEVERSSIISAYEFTNLLSDQERGHVTSMVETCTGAGDDDDDDDDDDDQEEQDDEDELEELEEQEELDGDYYQEDELEDYQSEGRGDRAHGGVQGGAKGHGHDDDDHDDDDDDHHHHHHHSVDREPEASSAAAAGGPCHWEKHCRGEGGKKRCRGGRTRCHRRRGRNKGGKKCLLFALCKRWSDLKSRMGYAQQPEEKVDDGFCDWYNRCIESLGGQRADALAACAPMLAHALEASMPIEDEAPPLCRLSSCVMPSALVRQSSFGAGSASSSHTMPLSLSRQSSFSHEYE
eukprot:g2058.t1